MKPSELQAHMPPPTLELTDRDFRRIVEIAREEAGLFLSESKRLMVQSRLSRRARASGQESIAAYLQTLSGADDGDADERGRLLSALTTNVTSFFREAHHFRCLEDRVLPLLAGAARSGEPVRIWSAGCSSGQEAYSIAMCVLATAPDIAALDFRILATDIDRHILAQARTGRYADTESAAIPVHIPASCYARDATGRMQVAPVIRNMVTFRELNLHGRWPMSAKFDVIFCRNVLIYFDVAHQRALWQRFHAQLKPDGWLFLGHSERIHPLEGTGFSADGITTYRSTGPWVRASERT